MNKKLAHTILILFDLFAFYGVWLGYTEIAGVITGVARDADSVSFLNRIGMIFVGIGVPLTHIFLIVSNHFWPSYFKRAEKRINRMIVIIGISIFAMAIFTSILLQSHVVRAGYYYCPELSQSMTFSTNVVYTKSNEICSQMAAEKKHKHETAAGYSNK